MRFRKSVTASIRVVGAGLLAAGCSSGNSSGSTLSSAPASTSARTSASATATGLATTSSATSTSAKPAAGTSVGTATSGAGCTVSVLNLSFGAKTGTAGQQTTQVVDLANKGGTACTMEGFPGVDLIGTANGQQNYSWPLERSSVSYSQVTLQPGETAHFNLTYLPFAPSEGTDFTVATIVLTPPNARAQAQLTWNQEVLLQDSATHPGTFIGPVTAGS